MPMNSRATGDPSIHSHSGDCDTDLSGKYSEYIEEHREALVAKCQRVNNCIEGLLKDENILLLLKGDNLSLNKTCSLIYENSSNADVRNGQCTAEDRDDIREDLEQHLMLQLDDAKGAGWKNVKKCLRDNYGTEERTTYVNDICRLAQSRPQICDNRNVHKNVTTFFNNQIQYLQCTCRSLQNSNTNNAGKGSILPVFLGGLAGGLLLLLVICVIGWIVYRRRRTKRKSKKRAPNVIYLPAPGSDNCPVYQELYDEKGYNAYGINPSGQPPALPSRYTRGPTDQEEESAYLEPVEAGLRFRPKLPVPGRDNPTYGAPPEYSERATDAQNVLQNKSEDESGFHRNLAKPENGYESVEDVMRSPTDDAPKPGDVQVVPSPAKRTLSNRQGEPGFVKLEKDGSRRVVDTTV
ncbi:unnamed protein product [Candidula unifasciata]|uniref:Uncharacterized protein n=1 Tax=Candidula unifasciata TaxID=100452 RepID=A0A8S3ZN43_9EUPU|nr:unnamed protein product [Candidula unifasciata]